MPEAATSITPLFIPSSQGRLFAVHHAPSSAVEPAGALIYLPPFAEEMNRSRRMASLQAQAFAAQGYRVLLLDLFGTGESEGDFGEACWEVWLDDVAAAADWIASHGPAKICLWGLRCGALLACAAASRQPKHFRRLLLWQPVLDGKGLMTQFLRIRLAAALGEKNSETTQSLRDTLASGTPVEVAGYELSPALVGVLDQIKLANVKLQRDTRVAWLEATRKADDPLLPASQHLAEAWRGAGIDVIARTEIGDPFWNIQETTLSPGFIDATTRLFQESWAGD